MTGNTEKKVLNLGCGKSVIKNAINVDFFQTECCDLVVDLSRFPWPWESGSIDEVYMLNFIEHFSCEQVKKIFKEVHRVLRRGGLLHVQSPHFTSMIALSDIDHKRCFGVSTFRALEGGSFVFPKPLFSTELVKINILATLPSENRYVSFDLKRTMFNLGAHPVMRKFLRPFMMLPQFLINLLPNLFERFWCYWIGGADEIVYRGRRV